MKTASTKENWQFCTVPVQPLSGVTYNNRMFIWTSQQQQTDTKRNYFFTIKFPRFKTGAFNNGTVSYQSYEYHVYLASYQSISNNTITEFTKIKLLKSFDVEAHDNDDVNKDKNIEIFFTINNNAPTNIGLYFELIPTLYDYQHPTGDESRIHWIWEGSPNEDDDNPILAEHAGIDTIGEFCRITNMITGNQIWNKIGVQTRPGVLLVVNRQPIRVGRSGIYEIYNGINIFQLAIITPGASTDYTKMDNFIIDYAYQS